MDARHRPHAVVPRPAAGSARRTSLVLGRAGGHPDAFRFGDRTAAGTIGSYGTDGMVLLDLRGHLRVYVLSLSPPARPAQPNGGPRPRDRPCRAHRERPVAGA